MILMFTTVSIQSFEHSKRKSNIQQLSVIIKVDVKSTVGKVGVLQRGQKNRGVEQEHFHSESQPSRPLTRFHWGTVWGSVARQWARTRAVCQCNDMVLSTWLQASWKDLASSSAPQVCFQWAVITTKVSSHTLTPPSPPYAQGMNALSPGSDQASGGQGVGVRKSSGWTVRGRIRLSMPCPSIRHAQSNGEHTEAVCLSSR